MYFIDFFTFLLYTLYINFNSGGFMDSLNKEFIKKVDEISNEILEIAEIYHNGEVSNGDYQSMIEAKIMEAIRYGIEKGKS